VGEWERAAGPAGENGPMWAERKGGSRQVGLKEKRDMRLRERLQWVLGLLVILKVTQHQTKTMQHNMNAIHTYSFYLI
jgi:hypothetical protein